MPVWLLFGIALGLVPSSSKAQDNWIGPTPMDYANMNMNFTNTLIMNNMIQRQVNERNGIGRSVATRKTSKPTSTAKSVNPATFTYTATAAQRNTCRDAYLANLAKRNAALSTSLRRQLGKYDYNTIYGSLLTGTGLRSDNLADALTAYTVQGWMIVNGVTADPSTAQIAAVRQQFANTLGTNTALKEGDTWWKVAEELKIKTVLLNSGWRDAQKLQQSAIYAKAIDAQFRSQMKLGLRQLSMSRVGLVTK